MSFDQNMIIDATKGSIARFVNHSCNPNCKMVKWIVGGKPRMALFAGDKPITTGEELTYDYNFDPFSAKNVQECRCGSENCRGILGPRPKDQKAMKETFKEAVKAGVKVGKRKLKELLGGKDEDDEENSPSPKKRKIKEAKGTKKSASSAGSRVAKGVATAIKKRVSAKVVSARRAVRPKRVIKKTAKAQTLETYGKRQSKVSSRNSSLTLVEGYSNPQPGPRSGRKSLAKNVVRSVRGAKLRGPRRAMTGRTIRVTTDNGD
jgi:histone-lysine N-methyltransferase ASH1L